MRVNGELYEVTDDIQLERNKKHNIEIVVDRLIIREDIEGRLADSVQTALQRGNGVVVIDVIDREELMFSEKFACIDCGISMEERLRGCSLSTVPLELVLLVMV